MPTLTLKLKNKPLGEYQLQKGVSLTIGRRKTNDVVIEDPAVSGHHAKIDSLDDRFVLIDLQSKNGSFVNAQLINSHWLKHEDIITIGGYTLIFHYDDDEVQELPGEPDKFDETQGMNTTQHQHRKQRKRGGRRTNLPGRREGSDRAHPKNYIHRKRSHIRHRDQRPINQPNGGHHY
jgi:pSer/pThr/pTyr-binding forkhead associated (FHA) protein